MTSLIFNCDATVDQHRRMALWELQWKIKGQYGCLPKKVPTPAVMSEIAMTTGCGPLYDGNNGEGANVPIFIPVRIFRVGR